MEILKETQPANDDAIEESVEGRKSFSTVSRESGEQLMVWIWDRRGQGRLMSYFEFRGAVFVDPGHLEVEFMNHKVVIKGRNLWHLCKPLQEHRITYLQEDAGRSKKGGESAPYIDEIVITEGRGGAKEE